MRDYYKILELHFGASSLEIKSAYRRLAFKYHPDKNLNDKNAEEKFKEVTEAYTILSDASKRIIYHAEYNDFLNSRYVNRIQNITHNRPRYYNPTDIPKQPRGPASGYKDNFNALRIIVFTGIVGTIIFLLFQANNELKVKERERQKVSEINIAGNKGDTISKDDFYKVIAQEFMFSGDSTLMNSNIDSLKHIFDSLQQVSRH